MSIIMHKDEALSVAIQLTSGYLSGRAGQECSTEEAATLLSNFYETLVKRFCVDNLNHNTEVSLEQWPDR